MAGRNPVSSKDDVIYGGRIGGRTMDNVTGELIKMLSKQRQLHQM